MRYIFCLLLILLYDMVHAQALSRYDILITEIMADPSPQVGLPNNEWIELKNVSSKTIDLRNFRIADATGQSGPMPVYLLQPDSMVIICTGSAAAAMSAFGPVLTVTSFPSLDNDGDLVYLLAPGNLIMHTVQYAIDWYGNELKQQGGWSLEMIDPKSPCSGKPNWKASTDIKGGTPGKKNSVNGNLADNEAPVLLRSYASNANNIYLVFNEPVDSLTATVINNYQLAPAIQITQAEAVPFLFNTIKLTLNQPLQDGTTYKLTVKDVRDCRGLIMSIQEVKTGMAAMPVSADIVINEILFNPRPNGYDYVELYNRSAKILDASNLHLANRNSAGQVASIKQISGQPFFIFPGDYIVITENAASLQMHYLVKSPGQVLQLPSLPSFPDDKGNVVLLNPQGAMIDEVNYNRDWHFRLIDNDEGVSLERINPEAPSQLAANWQSAASTAGYGTPTYINSQYLQTGMANMAISTTPKTFSPDNDGFDDFLLINYNVSEPGFVANITIFNAAGKPVKQLVSNGTMAYTGSWKWDGLDDNSQALPAGQYIIYTELFNLQGKKKQFKNVVVLARRL